MALSVSMKEGVLEVREELYSIDRTQVSWWYHDLVNRVSSSHGRENDELDRPMDDDAHAWVTKHYLPLVKPSQEAPGASLRAQLEQHLSNQSASHSRMPHHASHRS